MYIFRPRTDEHGQKIELKAQEAGITPKEFVDDVVGTIRGLWDLMDTSYDKFVRQQIQRMKTGTENFQTTV